MTEILIDLRQPDPENLTAGLITSMKWVPTTRYTVTDDEYVVLPTPMDVELVDGKNTINVEPTTASWVWRVTESAPKITSITRYLIVPDSETAVKYGSLVEVDPATLDPAAEPEAAWWAALNALPGGTASLVVDESTLTTEIGALEVGTVVNILAATSSGAGRVRLFLSTDDRTAQVGAVYDWSPTGLQTDPGDPFTVHTLDGYLYWLIDGGTHITVTFLTLVV